MIVRNKGNLLKIVFLLYVLIFKMNMVGFIGTDIVSAASTEQKVDRVLYINSYHRGYAWSDGVEEGLRQGLAVSGRNIEISTEYLDARRFAYGSQIEPLAQSMAIKYADYRPGLVIVSDNAAFDFAVKYRRLLFTGIPIVFCGYNNFRPSVLKGISNITGVNEEISIEDTVAMALKIHPATTTLAFITSTGEASSKRISEIAEESVFPELRKRFNLIILKDASIDEIHRSLEHLPKETLLFISGQTRDQGAGRALTPVENGRLITDVSPFPTYTFWDFHLNTGVTGGHILTGQDQGRTAASLALRILSGISADDIPVIMTSPTTDIFDFKVMKQFGIKEKLLPSGSVIINRPDTFYHKYKQYIRIMFGVFAMLSVLVLILLYLLRKSRVLGIKLYMESEERQKAVVALQQHQEHLEYEVARRTDELQNAYETLQEREILFHSMFDRHSAVMLLINPDNGSIIDANNAALLYYGYTLPEIKSMNIYAINQMDRVEIEQVLIRIKTELSKHFEFKHRLASGEIRNVEVYSSPIPFKGQDILFSIIHDITDRKEAETEREKLILELRESIQKIKTLSGLLPICASCKKIRNDKGYWEQMEIYIKEHSEADFSHGICPECAQRLYPTFYKKK